MVQIESSEKLQILDFCSLSVTPHSGLRRMRNLINLASLFKVMLKSLIVPCLIGLTPKKASKF